MKVLRHYQIDIIFYFIVVFVLTSGSFYLLAESGIEVYRYEWLVAGPLLGIYLYHLWNIRSKINLSERRRLTGRSLFYWTLLGIGIFAGYNTPLSASDYWSLNVLYLIFTLFLADSYWDFESLNLKNLFSKDNLK